MNEKKLNIRFLLQLTVKYGVYCIFVIMFVIFAFSNKNFFSFANIMLLIQQSAPLMIGVIGMTFVMISGGIDISAGANMYLSAAVAATFIVKLQGTGIVETFGGYVMILMIGVVVGGVIGTVNGFFVAQLNMVPFVVTLITTSIAQGISLLITDSTMIVINKLGFKLNDKSLFGISISIIIGFVMVAIFHYVLKWTVYGRQLTAQGNNIEAAKKVGFNTKRNTHIAYIMCGALCGFAGVLSAGMAGAVPAKFSIGNEFIIIPAAVLGGTSLFGGKGTIFPGAIIGILLVNTIMNGLSMVSADPYVYTIVRGFIIFLAIMVDSMNYKGDLR